MPLSLLRAGCSSDMQALVAVLALLPEELQPGVSAAALAPDDIKQVAAGSQLSLYTNSAGFGCAADMSDSDQLASYALAAKDVQHVYATQLNPPAPTLPCCAMLYLTSLATTVSPVSEVAVGEVCFESEQLLHNCALLLLDADVTRRSQCCTACNAWSPTPSWLSSC